MLPRAAQTGRAVRGAAAALLLPVAAEEEKEEREGVEDVEGVGETVDALLVRTCPR